MRAKMLKKRTKNEMVGLLYMIMISDQDEGEDVKKENEKRNGRFIIHDNDIRSG